MAVLVLTTVPDMECGAAIARALVEERLAACVNISGPMTSIYRWQGALEHAAEHQMVIKTVHERVADLQARIAALHPYDLPELVVLDVAGGGSEYLAWITAETSGSGNAGTR